MSYDLFLFCLTTVGVLGALIFSYKIARSRVYPIGIVRRGTPSQPVANNLSIKAYIDESGGESCRIENAVEVLGNAEETVAQYEYQPIELKAGVGKTVTIGVGAVSSRMHYVPTRLSRDRYRVSRLQQPPSLETEPPPTEKKTDPTLEKKVAEQGQALKALEQRLRRLEVQSVQSVLESQESDAPQAPQPETIN